MDILQIDSFLKDKLNLKEKNTHPCLFQKKPCKKGKNCPFIGLPNDTCLFFLTETCKFGEKCNKRHLEEFRNNYQNAKKEFKILNAACPCASQHGSCKYGDRCEFLGLPHNLCLYFLKGECTEGFSCPRDHNLKIKANLETKNNLIENYKILAEKDMEWLTKNTRVCPYCCLPVEKLEGCPSMNCKKCNKGFNWVS